MNRYLCKNSGLQILMHGVLSLPDATSYDNICAKNVIRILISTVNLIICIE